MKGKSGSMLITLIIIAVAVKGLTYVADGQIKSADPNGTFSGLISGFLGIADIMFYGLIAIIIILVPYYLSRRKRKAAEQQRPVSK